MRKTLTIKDLTVNFTDEGNETISVPPGHIFCSTVRREMSGYCIIPGEYVTAITHPTSKEAVATCETFIYKKLVNELNKTPYVYKFDWHAEPDVVKSIEALGYKVLKVQHQGLAKSTYLRTDRSVDPLPDYLLPSEFKFTDE